MNSSIFFNKSFRFAALASAVALGVFSASSSFAAAVGADTTADVIDPIAITNSIPLAFGRFASTGTAGTVIVDTANARTQSGGVILSDVDSTSTAAVFDVTGDGNATYGITWAKTVLTGSESGTMSLAKITDLTGGGGTTVADTASVDGGALTGGSQSIYLGGVLTVDANQAAGDYAGTVTATVEYN